MFKLYARIAAAFAGGVFVVFLLACGLNATASFVPRAAMIDNIRHSIPLMNHFRRSDVFTECLVMGSAVLPDQDLAHAVFDFPVLNAIEKDPTIRHDKGHCASLRAYVNGTPAAEIGTQSYTRYWNGAVTMARFTLAAMPFLPAFILYAVLIFGGFAVWGYALHRNGLSKQRAALMAFLAAYGGGFAFFAGNIAHSPAFFLPLWVLVAVTLATRWWDCGLKTTALASVIGGLTFYLDILFEAIPFNALMLATTALMLGQTKSWRSILLPLTVFGLSGGILLVTKLIGIGLLTDPSAVAQDFAHQLLWRMSTDAGKGESISYAALFFEHLPGAAGQIYQYPAIYWLTVVGGLACFVQAVRANLSRSLPFLILALIAPVWFALLPNHSWIHGTFAMRILFWPQYLGLLAYLVARDRHNLNKP